MFSRNQKQKHSYFITAMVKDSNFITAMVKDSMIF